jgi:hypothetical protein
MFRSSIFSSDPLRRLGLPPADLVGTIIVALVILASCEGAARAFLPSHGREWQYWDPKAAVKIERFRAEAEHGRYPEVLVLGDSTAASGIDPDILGSTLNARAYNLGVFAFYPRALRDCVLPLLAPARGVKIVVASFSTRSFSFLPRFASREQAVEDSAFCKDVQGDLDLVDRFYLTRAWFDLHRQVHPDRGPGMPADWSGFMPYAKAPPGESEEEHRKELQKLYQPVKPEEMPLFKPNRERLAVLHELVVLGAQRGFRVAYVMPPLWAPDQRAAAADEGLAREVRSIAAADARLIVLDYHGAEFLSDGSFFDQSHLRQDAAEAYTRSLARELSAKLRTSPPEPPAR